MMLVVVVWALVADAEPPKRVPLAKPPAPRDVCLGVYADSQEAMLDRLRAYENGPNATYARLLKTEITYETPYYAADGRIQQRRSSTAFFGTGFAYGKRGDEVYYVTNAHVANLPAVTSDSAKLDGIPPGSRKVLEETWIIERDPDESIRKIVKLNRVMTDALTDFAILKVRPPPKLALEVMPYRIGRSADLRAGNFVYVRGYPLGVFQAVNVGRVTNPFDDDHEQGWQHRDFIVDALLSSGHSGSPVFAVSCKTGQLELVGMYHAGYKAGSALNAVVAVDELREMMETLKLPKRAVKPSDQPLVQRMRDLVKKEISQSGMLPVFPFAGAVLTIGVTKDGAFVWSLYDKEFPASLERRMWILDTPDPEFGDIVRLGFRDATGVEVQVEDDDLDAGLQGSVATLYESMVRQVLATIDYRAKQRIDRKGDWQKGKAAQRELLEGTLNDLDQLARTKRSEEAHVADAKP